MTVPALCLRAAAYIRKRIQQISSTVPITSATSAFNKAVFQLMYRDAPPRSHVSICCAHSLRTGSSRCYSNFLSHPLPPNNRKIQPMSALNIFESIRSTTRRIEPFHSQFLADALCASLNGDRTLFDAFWRLAAPDGWEVPDTSRIKPEQMVDDRGKRIDICIFDEARKRILGIEVKTTDASTKSGQLMQYQTGLTDKEKFSGYQVGIAYLTPFNRKWAIEAITAQEVDSLPSVKAFDEFVGKIDQEHTHGKHVSWLDVAAIPWNGNELWRQHQLYVYQEISSLRNLRVTTQRDRSLDGFFGEEATLAFWKALATLEVERRDDGIIELDNFRDRSSFAQSLAGAFSILMGGEDVSRDANRSDRFEHFDEFRNSEHGEVHQALFDLSTVHRNVWIAGEGDYGVRVAHKKHPGGVSLVRSKDVDKLQIVMQR